MLLINDDKPQVWKGGKQSGTGAYDNRDLSLSGQLKLVKTLSCRKPGMHKRDTRTEPPAKTLHGLIGKGDLRNEDNDLLSF